jgi:cytochrome P450
MGTGGPASGGPAADLYYDPFDVELNTDPYALYHRLREEAPLYYNERHDFYALSRAADVERAFVDHTRLSSARSSVLDLIRADMEFPPGVFIFHDPPQHTRYRSLLARGFTPRKMARLESQVRSFCGRCLDPLVGSGGFDFVRDYGALVSSSVIGMLLGIPEADQPAIRSYVDGSIRNEPGKPLDADPAHFDGDMYAEYVDWRADHPSDDLMTELLTVRFEDEDGVTRRLTREEILVMVNLLSGAGNETTAKLIGWTGKLLADHPDQRALLVDDPALGADAVEEILRYEAPGLQNARVALEDVSFSGGTVPAGAVVLCLMAAANRDEARFPEAQRFDVRRRPTGILTFAFGIHFCLGAALARLQGRVALEEVLKRFPSWDVDEPAARLTVSSTTRGYESLPVVV